MKSSMNSDHGENKRYDFTIHTYGCKVNTYDTGLLQKRFEARGHRYVPSSINDFGLGARKPQIHILNTCAVTAEATREAAKSVRRIKAKDPFATLVITGCGAQVDGEVFDTLTGVDLVVANSHKGQLEWILDEFFKGQLKEKVFRSNIFRKDDLEVGGGIEAGHTRAFLKIQDGCNSFCTYCVIPFARGRSRSIPVRELVKRVRELSHSGVHEVVLTGVHIGDYEDEGQNRKYDLADLIEQILEQTEIPRIRLTSLEPGELTPKLLALYKNERMCPHFHMSIQSANSKILGAMRRKYSAEDVELSLKAIEDVAPNAFVGMDVIVGFPGESDDDFLDTYSRLEKLPWSRIHVFPYSERPGTKAVHLDGSVPRDLRSLRSQRLRDLSSVRYETRARQQIGATKKVLLLRVNEKGIDGLSRDYWPIKIVSSVGLQGFTANDLHRYSSLIGHEIDVRVTAFDEPISGRMDGVLMGREVRRVDGSESSNEV